ncbi:MAG: methyltransferase domain-containing protein [Dethiobacter sp.]|jgi:tRNA G37 N-methylase Trm5|nr:MAG: methyltransferase domain-containing protein [Dethiobacter sp.]
MPAIYKPLSMAREFVSAYVSHGDLVIDATAGNGHDTLFLARLVGEKGKVLSFDLQQEALEKTRRRLKGENLMHRVDLILDSHEHMSHYVHGLVSAIMFNLGYLPGGDHAIITRPETTVNALKAGLLILRPGGIITIVLYTGHEGGKEEKAALFDFCTNLNQQQFTVFHYCVLNQVNDPPSLLVIEKIH